jgi:peptide/nickel transport system ATP-binding protein
VLSVRELSVRFHTAAPPVAAVDRVSFDLERAGSLAFVGESGSGKTTLALALSGLLPPGAVVSGRVDLLGRDVHRLSSRELAAIRGTQIAMVFQDPLTALNPVLRIGTQVAECDPELRSLRRRAIRERTSEVLRSVGLDPRVAERYPHELSGGMRQRTLIAMALSGRPSLLVADEPTSSLDTVAQAAIVDLLRSLRGRRPIALLVATHDPAVAGRLCERIAVMYCGRVVEVGPAVDLLRHPLHPYTLGLWRSLPPPPGEARPDRLRPVPGSSPPADAAIAGCRFRERCSFARADCARSEPRLVDLGGDHRVACFHPVTS